MHRKLENRGIVYLVDDDVDLRRSMQWMLQEAGYEVHSFESATQFIEEYTPDFEGCLLLDMRMPEISGLELQEHMRSECWTLPVILLSAYSDISTAVRSMRAGAIDFLQKPVEREQLLERIEEAMRKDATDRAERKRRSRIEKRWSTLTRRERQVLQCVVQGLVTKQIAYDWDVSARTIEVHRARIMQKMKAHSVAELVHMVTSARLDVEVDSSKASAR